jgi:hypothetical protein
MAKDGKGKKAKGDKDGKSGNAKVPKKISGVKVPKQLRKLGNQAVKAAKDPVVSEIVAGALLAAAAALREGKDPKSAVGAAFKGGVKSVGKGARQEGGRLSDGLKMLALDLAKRTLDGMGEKKGRADSGGAEAPAPAPPSAEVRPAPPAKPKAPPQG